MNEITVFNNENFGDVRTIRIDDEPWFVGRDVAKILGYANTNDALANNEEPADAHDEDEFLDKFIEAQIEWEKEMWGDDDPTAGFLPYEK